MWPEVNEHLDPVTTSMLEHLNIPWPLAKIRKPLSSEAETYSRCFLRPKIKWLNPSCNLPTSMLV